MSPEGRHCKKFGDSLHIQAKLQHIMWFHKYEIKLKYVQIQLEMLTSSYLLDKLIKIDIFHVNIIR